MNVWNGVGRMTRDVELRFIAGSGKAVANGAIAVDKEGLSKDKREEMQAKGIPTADFPTFVAWGKNAENMAQLCKKGTLISITGSIQTSTYKTDKGETRYRTDVLVHRWKKLEWGDKQQSSGDNFNYGIDPSEFQAIDSDSDIPF
jgi:single-strand DNA-binding protein